MSDDELVINLSRVIDSHERIEQAARRLPELNRIAAKQEASAEQIGRLAQQVGGLNRAVALVGSVGRLRWWVLGLVLVVVFMLGMVAGGYGLLQLRLSQPGLLARTQVGCESLGGRWGQNSGRDYCVFFDAD